MAIRKYIKLKINAIKEIDNAILKLSINESKGLIISRKLMLGELKVYCKNNKIKLTEQMYDEKVANERVKNRENGAENECCENKIL